MRNKKPGMSALIVVLACMTSLCACSKGEVTSSAVFVPSAPTTTTTTAPLLGLNPLTGQRDMETDLNRPVAVVVTDESSTLAQINPENADMYFESETEAGIPRLLAVFSSVDRLPDEIGPVRSARPHFVKIAKSLDAIYCHIGGSNTGLNTISSLGVQDISNASQVNKTLQSSQNYSWNTKTFVKSKVLDTIAKRNYRTTSSVASPFAFGSKTGTLPASTVTVGLSENCQMRFTYSNGVYTKSRPYAMNTPHVTTTGGTITATNVIVMFDRRTFDEVYTNSRGQDSNRYNFDLNSGTGMLFTGGTGREIRWSRTNEQLSFTESDGTTRLTVGEGKTFVCLVSDTLKGNTVAQ